MYLNLLFIFYNTDRGKWRLLKKIHRISHPSIQAGLQCSIFFFHVSARGRISHLTGWSSHFGFRLFRWCSCLISLLQTFEANTQSQLNLGGVMIPQMLYFYEITRKQAAKQQGLPVPLQRERLQQEFSSYRLSACSGRKPSGSLHGSSEETRLCYFCCLQSCISFPCGQEWKQGVFQTHQNLCEKQLHLQLMCLWECFAVLQERS